MRLFWRRTTSWLRGSGVEVSTCMKSIQFPNLGYVKDAITNQQIPNLLQWIDSIDHNTTTINHSHVGVI